MSLSNHPHITARVKAPRWARVRFPRGAMFGEPGHRDKQLGVLRAVLAGLAAITEPGGHLELPYRWEAAPVGWRGRELTDGSAS